MRSNIEFGHRWENAIDNSHLRHWQTLTATLITLMDNLMNYASREKIKEETKVNPDTERIKEFNSLYLEALGIYNYSDKHSYKTLDQLKELIEHYDPIYVATLKRF